MLNGGELLFPPLIYGSQLASTNQKQDHIEEKNMDEAKKSIKEYSYSDDTGDAQAVVYHLFPGVEVAYTSVHMADLRLTCL